MYILGIESSCDETSAAVVSMEQGGRRILSNIVASQIETHRLYGGVVPEIASRAHIEAISSITYEALATAGVTIKDIGCIAVTSHPGLIGALLVGVNFAKSLAFANKIPLVPVITLRHTLRRLILNIQRLSHPLRHLSYRAVIRLFTALRTTPIFVKSEARVTTRQARRLIR